MNMSEGSLAKDRFLALISRNLPEGLDGAVDLDSLWLDLSNYYAQDFRRYHTLSHLLFCLSNLDKCKESLISPDQVEMAIWYHDIIYVPGSPDNEKESRDYFIAKLGRYLPDEFQSGVCDLIMVTDLKNKPATPDQQYMCDIDVSSFGLDWQLFLHDSRDLYKEEVGPETEPLNYIARKIRFFEAVIEHPPIFYTEFFRELYEDKANANISRFLKLLESRDALTILTSH